MDNDVVEVKVYRAKCHDCNKVEMVYGNDRNEWSRELVRLGWRVCFNGPFAYRPWHAWCPDHHSNHKGYVG